ncbi:acyl carrier protein [Streptomyces sp. TLI_171]|uniref:acyl carrier protein n=1 Tax=Streptomyces sp. TLI_171 TaxID=1938859 RepID=UPI000C188E21|nr:acyl carrier protein [Streptomyces sp. TLI_171]RKE16985.1 phosphopantetheine binding protein [Streptomyces sp. TLI_171]
MSDLRRSVAELVSRATDGTVGVPELLDSTAPLTALGVSSLSLLRLADSLEEEFGVFVDLADRTLYTAGLDGLTAHVRELGGTR